MKHYFAFIDESGNGSSEPFFGLGVLLVEDVGSLYDAIKPHYDRAVDIAKLQKEKTVNELLMNEQFGELAAIAKSGKNFELKFKMVNFTNNTVYQELVRTYFKFPGCRFSAIVIDRQDPSFKPNEMFASPWQMYLSYAATLLASNINNLGDSRICVLADDLTKPRTIGATFEESLQQKIHQKLKNDGMDRSVFHIARLESHSSLMIQLVDVLLGAVLYDFKKERGLIGERLAQRQEPVVQEIRSAIQQESLAGHFTVNKPNYFNVWKMRWRN